MITMETQLWVFQWRCSQRALPERKDLPGLWVVHPMACGIRLRKRRKGADTSIPLALLPDCRFRGTTFPSYATSPPHYDWLEPHAFSLNHFFSGVWPWQRGKYLVHPTAQHSVDGTYCGPSRDGAWQGMLRSSEVCPWKQLWDTDCSFFLLISQHLRCFVPSCLSVIICCPYQRSSDYGPGP